jgi:hypothetical protein
MDVAGDLNAPTASSMEGFPLSTELAYAWDPGPICTLLAVDPYVTRALAVLRLGPVGSDFYATLRVSVLHPGVSGSATRAPGTGLYEQPEV